MTTRAADVPVARTDPATFVAIPIALTLIACASFVLSLNEARLSRDVFHWGSLYGYSYDLLRARMPYRDTYEVYGLLSSVIYALAMLLTSKSLIIPGVVAGLFYSGSLILTYKVGRRFTSALPALCGTIAAFLVHPRIQYPWPNYIAYCFMLAALFVLLNGRHNVAAGVLFGLAILARHSFLLAIAPALLGASALGLVSFRAFRAVGAGVGATLLPFGVFLAAFNLWYDFYRVSVSVTRAILSAIGEWQSIPTTFDFARRLVLNIALNNPANPPSARMVAFTIVAGSGIVTLLFALLRHVFHTSVDDQTSAGDADRKSALVALFALAGFSQALHAYEVFRLATAVGVGFVLPFYLIAKLPSRAAVWLLSLTMVAVLGKVTARDVLATSTADVGNVSAGSDVVELLRFKRWPKDWFERYAKVHATLVPLSSCGVTDLVNLGYDPLVSYLVPEFGKPQREPTRMPWHRSDEIFPDEPRRRSRLISAGRAAVITTNDIQLAPGPGLFEIYADGKIRIWAPPQCRP